jgi:RNase P subunit RPR2
MPKKLLKHEAQKQIDEFFRNIEGKTKKDVKKIKRLAMRHNIHLGEKRKMFCRNCLTPYKNPKVRIRKRVKIVECRECYYVSRWRL